MNNKCTYFYHDQVLANIEPMIRWWQEGTLIFWEGKEKAYLSTETTASSGLSACNLVWERYLLYTNF